MDYFGVLRHPKGLYTLDVFCTHYFDKKIIRYILDNFET